MSYSKEDLKDLYEGRLPWPKIKEIMSRPKDDDRYEKYVEILQERMPWKERILLPIGEHLAEAEVHTVIAAVRSFFGADARG